MMRARAIGAACGWALALWAPFTSAATLTASGASKNVTVTLVAERDAVRAGEPLVIGLQLKMAPEWHTYWLNPGDSGLPTRIRWRLPEGFEPGPLQWPRPQQVPAPPLMSYGYEHEVLLLSEIRTPAALAGQEVTIGARVDWLECKEACLPGKADLELRIPAGDAPRPQPEWEAAFASSRERLPGAPPAGFSASATPSADGQQIALAVNGVRAPKDAYFFSSAKDVLDHAAPQTLARDRAGWRLTLTRAANAALPDALTGVLTLEGRAYAIQVPMAGPVLADSVAGQGAAPAGARGGPSTEASAVAGGDGPAIIKPPTLSLPTAPAPVQTGSLPAVPAHRGGGVARSLWVALAFAFVGGLILNLMPCVLPVLSLKVMSFVRHGSEARGGALRHALAFSAGVLAFFWILAGALLALRAGGEQIGWGFQLQSPPFVVFLSGLFLLVALNLFGVFEVGQSLTAAANLESRSRGLASSFWSGALATIVATPCTAPFMGSALGFALSEPAWSTLLVFTALGAGMAAPYLVLGASPALLKLLPRPGRWMETFKQAMGFPMLGTVVFLVWLFGRQAGVNAMSFLLVSLVMIAMGAWLYGRAGLGGRRLPLVAAAGALVAGGLLLGISQAESQPGTAAARVDADGWEAFSEARLAQLRESGTPVFVDFTADWCLTCQVNARVALSRPEVQARFKSEGIVMLKADWTLRDEAITRALAAHGRQGVPLYVLYGRGKDAPARLLPEVLTAGLVLETLEEVF